MIAHCIGSRSPLIRISRTCSMCPSVVSVASDLFDPSIHFLSFFIISLITLLFLLPNIFNFHDVVDIPCVLLLRTLAPWPGTSLPQVMSPTTTEPNDPFITEAYVEYTQESSGEQRYPDDFDYDDVTIGKTLLDACRRQADHSEEEGLSSCLSSSVSHCRTGRPVVCSSVERSKFAQETQKHTSESEQIRTLLERHREQILADCQAEIRKHEFQADYD